jgi:hypothetical protein
VRDEQPGLGPRGGLRAGLQHARGELCFVTSTDAPFLTGAFVRAVLAPGIAAAPVSDGHIQTLAAAYPRAPGAEKARELLAAGRRRPLDLLEALGYRELPAETLPDAGALEGFNTPDEYLAAVGEAAEDGQAATATLEFLGHARQLAGCDSMKVPVGRLGRVLDHAPASAGFVENGRLAAAFLVSLGGCYSVRDLAVPIGPGEHVQLRDAATSISRPTPGHLDD